MSNFDEMSPSELAIAAVKAQALWDAAELLRQRAAEAHPYFERELSRKANLKAASEDVPSRDKQVVALRNSRFAALVNTGVEMREFDLALAVLGIELSIDTATQEG